MKLKNNNFYIIRHGQTAYQTVKKNFVYPWEGSVNTAGITEIGKQSIRKVIPKIKKLSIDILYASDFKRTRETAEMIAREIELKKENFVLTSRLRDVNLGKYHGGRKKDFYNDFPDFLNDFNQKPEDGESLSSARDRIVAFINEIDGFYKNKNILIVSHGEPLWLLEGALKGIRESDSMDKNKNKINYIQPGELRKLN